MAVLTPLFVYLDQGNDREHFTQAERILQYASKPVKFMFLQKKFTRWHVPLLAEFGYLGLWVSNEFPVTFDILALWQDAKKDVFKAVYLLEKDKHEARPELMLFRNKYCEQLTSDYIYSATPEQLNPETWSGGPQNIGVLRGEYASLPVPLCE